MQSIRRVIFALYIVLCVPYGWFYDITGSYISAFYLSGSLFIVTGLLLGILPVTKCFHRHQGAAYITSEIPTRATLHRAQQNGQKRTQMLILTLVKSQHLGLTHSLLKPTALSNIIITTALSNIIMTTALSNIIITTALSNIIITTALSNIIKSTALSNIIKPTALSNIIITTALSNIIKPTALSNIIITTALSNIIITTALSNIIITTALSNIIKPTALSNIIITTALSNIIITAALFANNQQGSFLVNLIRPTAILAYNLNLPFAKPA
ncbi:hypothetical protein KUTeg_007552 [Tegillarca granosa]|uniref:Uncharacterized protein n=1 Tax=Tegillarca granosa TaxID=220873 RepID=A0ABQ9FHL5_TEGGR|nr:hypothetical protein KUTeg_007552 [Tegillarca granosa]